jgi:uncharacterized protein (TIGR00251 family)
MSRNLKGKLSDPVSGAAFTVRVVTRATKTEAVGVQEDGALKVRLKASPAGDPAANEELLNFLAGTLEVSVKDLEIVAGATGRDKLITVAGVSTDDVEARFGSLNG